jgi:hypothetical protein
MVRLHECATPLFEVTQFRIPPGHAGTSGGRKKVIRSRDKVGSCQPIGDGHGERGIRRLLLKMSFFIINIIIS